MSDLNCTVNISNQPGLKEGELTVGREFNLICAGNVPQLNLEKAQFVWAEEQQKYSLKLLKAKVAGSEGLELTVTSYLAAKISIPDLKLTDGEKTLSLGAVNFEVASVIEQKEKQEPYGPMGPFSIEWPVSYTAFFILIAATFFMWFISLLWRRKRAKALLEKLSELETVLSPEAQFFKDLRLLKRESEIFIGSADPEVLASARDRIERMFKVFISREMRVLATELGSKKIMIALKRQERWKKLAPLAQVESDVATLMHEFEKSHLDQVKISNQDVMQLISHSQKVIEKLSRAGEVKR